MFTSGSIWALYTRRDLLLFAGLLGALAAATRNVGLLLLIPLFIEWYRNRREFGSSGLAGILLVPTGLVAYGIFLAGRFRGPDDLRPPARGILGAHAYVSPVATLQGAWSFAVEGAGYWLQPGARSIHGRVFRAVARSLKQH